jgi:hypothetical protein
MAVGRELYLVAGLGSFMVFVLLEARPVVRRLEDFLRSRVRELVLREEDEDDEHRERGKRTRK